MNTDCKDGNDERIYSKEDFNKKILYSEFCLGLAAQRMFDYTYRDFQHCELWPCDNPYTHYDKIWDCPNGIDELKCSYSNCSSNEHQCYDDQSNN
ncbi:hypothetical protein I4U23_005395 [Adineta vaga]|nr:hypothetical protein I4U23_005395 [Adineta vaga]